MNIFFINIRCKMSSLMGGMVWSLNHNKKKQYEKVKAHLCDCTTDLCRNLWVYQWCQNLPAGLKKLKEKLKRRQGRDRDTNQQKRGNISFNPQQHWGSLPQLKYKIWKPVSFTSIRTEGTGLPCTSSRPPSPRQTPPRLGSWSRSCARWWRFWCRTSPRPDGFPRAGWRRPPRPPSSAWCSPLEASDPAVRSLWADADLWLWVMDVCIQLVQQQRPGMLSSPKPNNKRN